ncbi:MAG: hypothetical protein HDR05_14670 [Lachnospiraceae bacterium]|nr:hypothetical protein [Lachnospiraceae bacterium]
MKKGISALFGMAVGAAAAGIATGTTSSKKIKEMKEVRAKVHGLYMAYDRWLRIRQEGKTLVEYFTRNGYKTVAVYGMKELGERLCDELKGSEVTVKYAIDKKADSIYADVDVVTPDDEMAPVDIIVVTAIYYFDEIEEMMSQKVECPIISLEDVLYEM